MLAGLAPEPLAHQDPADAQVAAALLPEVARQLRQLQRHMKLSTTDLVNRAITAYWFIDEEQRAGHGLLIRDGRTGETRLVRFL